MTLQVNAAALLPFPPTYFPIDDFSDEVKLKMLLRWEKDDLIHYSYTNKNNYNFVWLTPDLLDKIISWKIIALAFTHFPQCKPPFVDISHWHFTVALARHDLDRALQFSREHLDTCLQATSIMEIAGTLNASRAIKILMLAAKIVKDDRFFNRAFEFLENIVRRLAPLDTDKAFEVCQMIEAPGEQLAAKAAIAICLPHEEKNNLLKEVVGNLQCVRINEFLFHRILEHIGNHVPFEIMKSLFDKATDASIFYYLAIKCFHQANRIKRQDPQWILSFIDRIEKKKYRINGYCRLAFLSFETEAVFANQLIEKSLALTSREEDKGDCYRYIADALKKSAPDRAEHFYVKAIEEGNISSIPSLAELNLEAALEYNDRIIDPPWNAYNLCEIAKKTKNRKLFKQGMELLLHNEKGERNFVLLCFPDILQFGDDFAIDSIHQYPDTSYRVAMLLKISKDILPRNPQRAYQLAKETIALSLEFKEPHDKIKNLFHFIFPHIM